MECFLDLHTIIVQGHANLLCIIPVVVYVLPKRACGVLYPPVGEERGRGCTRGGSHGKVLTVKAWV